MILLTKALKKKLPPLYATNTLGDAAVVQVKFFTPDSFWTWYAIEFDGEDRFFGMCCGFENELGYFSLSELEAIRGPYGLSVERDRFFQPITLGALKGQLC